MISLTHPDGRFVVCATERTAVQHEALGYRRCTWAALRRAWQRDDCRRVLALFGPARQQGARIYDAPQINPLDGVAV